MKRFLLSLVVFAYLSVSISFAAFTSSVSLSDKKEASYTKTIDTVLGSYITKHTTKQLHINFPVIHKKIEKALDKKGVSKDITFFLEYLDRYILDWLAKNKEEKPTTPSTPSQDPSSISPKDYDEGSKTIAVDRLSGPVVAFEVDTQEDVVVEEFIIKGNTDELEDAIKKIYVYDSTGKLIATESVEEDVAEFSEKFTLKKGDNTLYLSLLPVNDGKTISEEEFTFTLILDELESKTSGKNLDSITVKNTDDEITLKKSTSTSSQDTTSISPKDYDEGSKTIAIDRLSGPVVAFEVTANLDDIFVEEFTIKSNNSGLKDTIKKISVYDSKGKLIATESVQSDSVEFSEEFTLKKGDNTLYLALLPVNIKDKEISDEEFTFTLTLDELESKTSGKNIDPITVKNTDDKISVAKTTIGSSGISLLKSYNSWFVDSKLYNQARADVAIISVDFGKNSGNDDILLNTLELTLKDGTASADFDTTIQLKRIDSVSDAISLDKASGDQITFDLKQLGDKKKVKQGTTAVFLVSGVPLLHSTQSESITIELDTNTTQDGIITYTTEESDTIIKTKGFGYIGKNTIGD